MKMLGRRSLSSLFKVLADVAFYLICVSVIASLGVSFFALRGMTDQIDVTLPVHFTMKRAAYEIDKTDGGSIDATVEGATGNVSLKHPPTISVLLTTAGVLLGEAVLLLVLLRLRRIFRRLVEGRPFIDDNARSLRVISLAVIAGELMWAALQYVEQGAIARALTSPQISFFAVFAPRLPVLGGGLVLLIIAEIFREGIKMRADLETAREIQKSLVAPEATRHGPVSIEARMQAAAEVGGDYYDAVELDGGRLAFVVADVAGKGLPAALLMTLLRGSLRSLIAAGLRGTALMTVLNKHLMVNTPDNRMITCFYGELDPHTGVLTYINAGHNPPYLYNAHDRQSLDSTAIVLGMFDTMPFPESSVTLGPGARLLLYTDGVTEAEGRDGDQFGTDRLEQAITDAGQSDPKVLVDTMMERVERFRGAAPQSDDITVMVISREEAAAAV